MNNKRKITLILLVLCLVTIVLAIQIIRSADQWRTSKIADLQQIRETPVTGSVQPVPAVDLTLPSVATFEQLVERPLFMSSRRPPEPDDEPEPEPEPLPDKPPQSLKASLSSIMITEDRRMALVRDLSSNKTVRLQVGSTLSGWKVRAIDNDQVIFSQNNKTQILPLRIFDKQSRKQQKKQSEPTDAEKLPQRERLRRIQKTRQQRTQQTSDQ